MDPNKLADEAARMSEHAAEMSVALHDLAWTQAHHLLGAAEHAAATAEPFIYLLTIFLMACFVGYYVVWNVTPALHSPLMAVTNAISSVIVVGAMLATGLGFGIATVFGFIAVALASVNIFGGFVVTQRMLSMFKSKK